MKSEGNCTRKGAVRKGQRRRLVKEDPKTGRNQTITYVLYYGEKFEFHS